VFTMHADPVIVSRALEVGATGYVLKDTSSDEVLKAFQKVREGRPYLSHDVASEVAFMEARGTTNPLKRMTVRELQRSPSWPKASPMASSPNICM
jgi:two-component system, NarL family, invasion response regulator UvrY